MHRSTTEATQSPSIAAVPTQHGHRVSVATPSLHFSAWTSSLPEASALAEALYDARPKWRIRIDGRLVVFSREGKVAQLA